MYLLDILDDGILKLAFALEEIGEVFALVFATNGAADFVPLGQELLYYVARRSASQLHSDTAALSASLSP